MITTLLVAATFLNFFKGPSSTQHAEAAFAVRNGLIVFEVEQTPLAAIGGGLDGDIFTVSPDGSALQQLTDGPDDDYYPAWSPDGRHIAFTRGLGNRGSDIYVMTADGSDLVNLTAGAPLERDYGPSWSPDGTRIVFVSSPLDGVANSTEITNSDLYVMDSDGQNVTRLTTASGNEISPSWSPDGAWIAYVQESTGSIRLISEDGSLNQIVKRNLAFPSRISWSPDGQRLAFSMGQNTLERDVWLIDVDGANLEKLTRDPASSSAEDLLGSWSPDGKKILYVSDREGPYYLFTISANGTRPERVVDIEVSGTSTSPHWGRRP